MNKAQLQELIQADLDGELSATGRADLARLLLQDPEARRLQDEFRKTDQLLRSVAAAEPPPDLRAAILAGHAQSARPGKPGHPQYGWPAYRMAAVIVGGLLIVGLGYLVRDGHAPVENLQGSVIAPQDHWSMRADGVDVSAVLQRNGDKLRLELNSSATIPYEVIARIDPATTTFVGKTGDARLTAASAQVTVQPAIGNQAIVLEFSGAAPIQLELRSGGRLLGEGRLSVP
jgi:hypothetical protein